MSPEEQSQDRSERVKAHLDALDAELERLRALGDALDARKARNEADMAALSSALKESNRALGRHVARPSDGGAEGP